MHFFQIWFLEIKIQSSDLILPLLFLKISWNREDFAIFWKTRTSSCQYTFAIKIDNGQILNVLIKMNIWSSNNYNRHHFNVQTWQKRNEKLSKPRIQKQNTELRKFILCQAKFFSKIKIFIVKLCKCNWSFWIIVFNGKYDSTTSSSHKLSYFKLVYFVKWKHRPTEHANLFTVEICLSNWNIICYYFCGSNAFQGNFDDAKESRVKQSFKQRFKNQDQDSRIKRRLNQDKY